MKTTPSQDLRGFHTFLSDKVASGTDLSPEEILDEWRGLHPDSAEFEEEVAAIQEALDDIANGDKGIPLEEFDREFRKEHNIPDHK